jgi:hypothetical protein
VRLGLNAKANASRPGSRSRLRPLVVELFDETTATRILLPAIADLQHEVAENAAGSHGERALLRWRCYLAVWRTFAVCLLFRRGGASAGESARVLLGAGGALVLVTAVFMTGPVSRFAGGWPTELLLLLLPQALAVSIPCSVIGAGLLRRRWAAAGRGGSASFVRATLGYSIVAATVCAAVMGWVLPTANQRFRESVYGIATAHAGGAVAPMLPVTKGYPEMTVSELLEVRRQTVPRFDGSHSWILVRELAGYHIHLKAALPAASLALGLMTVALAPGRRRRFSVVHRIGIAFVTLVAYYAVFAWCRTLVGALVVPAWIGAWAPPVLFSAVALLILRWRVTRLSDDACASASL